MKDFEWYADLALIALIYFGSFCLCGFFGRALFWWIMGH